MTNLSEEWNKEAYKSDRQSGSWPFFNLKFFYHKEQWLINVNGSYSEFETRSAAFRYLSGLLLTMSTHPEPRMDAYYSEEYRVEKKRSWNKYGRDHDKARELERKDWEEIEEKYG